MQNFLSEDKKTISIPVPLGSEIYSYHMDCGDFCLHQNDLFYKMKEESPDLFLCAHDAACHTMKPIIETTTLSEKNFGLVLKYWNDWFFETREKAEKRAVELRNRNINLMKEKGFLLREDGYSATTKGGFGALGNTKK